VNRNSSNPVFLQQKIIHLQAELSKFKSLKKEKLLFENQQLREHIKQLHSENELLKKQLATTQVAEQTAPVKQPIPTTKKQTSRPTKGDSETLANGWFMSNLIHERSKK
jgi:hypothetical protein